MKPHKRGFIDEIHVLRTGGGFVVEKGKDRHKDEGNNLSSVAL